MHHTTDMSYIQKHSVHLLTDICCTTMKHETVQYRMSTH